MQLGRRFVFFPFSVRIFFVFFYSPSFHVNCFLYVCIQNEDIQEGLPSLFVINSSFVDYNYFWFPYLFLLSTVALFYFCELAPRKLWITENRAPHLFCRHKQKSYFIRIKKEGIQFYRRDKSRKRQKKYNCKNEMQDTKSVLFG